MSCLVLFLCFLYLPEAFRSGPRKHTLCRSPGAACVARHLANAVCLDEMVIQGVGVEEVVLTEAEADGAGAAVQGCTHQVRAVLVGSWCDAPRPTVDGALGGASGTIRRGMRPLTHTHTCGAATGRAEGPEEGGSMAAGRS